jgi:hypothetical protein
MRLKFEWPKRRSISQKGRDISNHTNQNRSFVALCRCRNSAFTSNIETLFPQTNIGQIAEDRVGNKNKGSTDRWSNKKLVMWTTNIQQRNVQTGRSFRVERTLLIEIASASDLENFGSPIICSLLFINNTNMAAARMR